KRSWTRRKIAPFVAAMKVDTGDLVQPLESFASFSDFISRRIDLSKRPIVRDPQVLASPVDGRVLAYPVVDARTSFRIKSSQFDLARLVADDELAARYDGGAVVIFRLYLADYHHFHFPDSGIAGEPRAVSGAYLAVSPYARRWAVPFYAEN